MSALRVDSQPVLRAPILVAAFHGWNDGGNAATLAANYLRTTLDAVEFATIDPEQFVDFQVTRPRVSLDGRTRHITWPETRFAHAPLPGRDRDIVICIGTEPNLRWRTFATEITSLSRALEIELAITLGGLLADTPHTRPVPVSGTAQEEDLALELGFEPSTYEGPTGIVGVLHDELGKAGLRSASLWAAVPHYIAANANPSAALALIRHLEPVLGVEFDAAELEGAAQAFSAQLTSAIEDDEETARYVRELERRADLGEDEDDSEDDEDRGDGNRALPTGDEIADALQRFLRERRDREDP